MALSAHKGRIREVAVEQFVRAMACEFDVVVCAFARVLFHVTLTSSSIPADLVGGFFLCAPVLHCMLSNHSATTIEVDEICFHDGLIYTCTLSYFLTLMRWEKYIFYTRRNTLAQILALECPATTALLALATLVAGIPLAALMVIADTEQSLIVKIIHKHFEGVDHVQILAATTTGLSFPIYIIPDLRLALARIFPRKREKLYVDRAKPALENLRMARFGVGNGTGNDTGNGSGNGSDSVTASGITNGAGSVGDDGDIRSVSGGGSGGSSSRRAWWPRTWDSTFQTGDFGTVVRIAGGRVFHVPVESRAFAVLAATVDPRLVIGGNSGISSPSPPPPPSSSPIDGNCSLGAGVHLANAVSRGDVTWKRDGEGREEGRGGDTSGGAESDHFFFYVKEHECWVRLEKIWNCSQGRSYMDRKAPRLKVEASFRNRKRPPRRPESPRRRPKEKENGIATGETAPSSSIVGASTSLLAKLASARSRFTIRGRKGAKPTPVM